MNHLRTFRLRVAFGFLALLVCSAGCRADGFDDWLVSFKAEAEAAGIDRAVLDQALGDVRPIDRVLDNDRRQPEFSISFADYLARTVSAKRVRDGRQRLLQNRKALARIAQHYGVPAPVIVAMWGIETDYGRVTGNFPVVASLATLAYDGRRSAYFRGELLKALTMVAKGVPLRNLQGSWAGAMGQCQFMPSTYLTYAQAAKGDGPADIWGTTEDVWASTANYLAGLDWRRGQPSSIAVRLPKHGMAAALYGLDRPRDIRDWRRLGLKRSDGKGLKGPAGLKLALIHADAGKDGKDGTGPSYLVGDNFRALMHWNRSFFFALSAGTLADRIGSR